MRYQLDSSSHSVYSLNYHLIFCVKYRRKVLTDRPSGRGSSPATLMTLNTNICVGPCPITAGVSWQNLGSSSITFTPAILIDGTTMVYSMDITIPAGETGSSLITTPILSIGSHVICPYPN